MSWTLECHYFSDLMYFNLKNDSKHVSVEKVREYITDLQQQQKEEKMSFCGRTKLDIVFDCTFSSDENFLTMFQERMGEVLIRTEGKHDVL